MKELQELRNEVLSLRNMGELTKQTESILLHKLNALQEAINYTRCSTQLKDKEAMSFNDWVESEGYEENFTGFWKDGKSQDYWTMKDRYNVYRNNL